MQPTIKDYGKFAVEKDLPRPGRVFIGGIGFIIKHPDRVRVITGIPITDRRSNLQPPSDTNNAGILATQHAVEMPGSSESIHPQPQLETDGMLLEES